MNKMLKEGLTNFIGETVDDLLASIPEFEIRKRGLRPAKSTSIAAPTATHKLNIWRVNNQIIQILGYTAKRTCKHPLTINFVSVFVIPTPSKTRLI